MASGLASVGGAKRPVRPSKADKRRLARLFHALSDETRLEVVQQLLAGEQCVCDLTAALDTGQSRLSFHLKTLKEAGLVTDRREGRWVYYALVPEALRELGTYCGAVGERAGAQLACG